MFGAEPVAKVTQDKGGARALPDDAMAGIRALLALPPQTESVAPFFGDYTAIQASSNNGMVMARQPDCSLSAFNVPYSMDVDSPYSGVDSTTTNLDQMLHSAAGLTTNAGHFVAGCGDPLTGVEASDAVYAGVSTGGMRMSAIAVYNASTGYNALYTFVMKADGTYLSTTQQQLMNNNSPLGLASADLNGDGNPDLVAVGYAPQGSGSSFTEMVSVLLGNADGTFTIGQTYTLTANLFTDSLVIDDFNGDGKLDLVIAEGGASAAGGNTKLTFLPGNGNGTFGTPVSLALSSIYAENIISGDFNGDGKKDIASGNGYVFLVKGDGTFQAPTAPAFPQIQTNSSTVAELAAGDFNKDGKLDLAAGNGDSIYIYLGNGDGTFSFETAYASIDNHGHLMATDIDGDGNLDLFSGNAQAGAFTGDDFTPNEGYALMGHGDGTFSGAPEVTYAHFLGLQDLNGDGKLDFIGNSGGSTITNSPGPSFATYYGHGDGTFQQSGATLTVSTATYQGTSYAVTGIDSYATGDLDGDSRPDLVMIPEFGSPAPSRAGLVTSIANADGSFQSPVFTPVPTLLAGGDGGDDVTYFANLMGATNQNGKFEVVYAYASQIYVASNNSVQSTQGYATQVSNGDGTLAAPVVTVTATASGNFSNNPAEILSVTDLNGDKIPDLIVDVPAVFASGGVVTSPEGLAVMLGKADGSFGAATPLALPEPYAPNESISIGDLNGDGIPDLAFETLVNTQTNTTWYLEIALGKGDGSFTFPTPLQLENFGNLGSPAIGDFNHDGKADVAIGGSGVYPGNGDGTLQTVDSGLGNGTVVPPLTLPLSAQAGPSAAYDVNGDGKMDLVTGGTFLLQSTAPATTTASSTTTLTASASSISAGQNVTFTATVAGPSGNSTAPTGTVTFLDGTTSIGTGGLNASGVATFASASLAQGSHSITASYGGDANFASSLSATVTVSVNAATVTPVASSTALTTSASSVGAGQSVTLNAVVTGSSGSTAVPTGTVTFVSGATNSSAGVSLGTGTLSNGAATLTTTSLPVGTDSVTASYGGDTNFASSVSPAVTITVAGVPDFSLSLSPSSASISKNGSASTTVSVTPSNGFTSAVTFACSGVPSGASCSFSPATVTPSGSTPSTTKLTISTGTNTALLEQRRRSTVAWGMVALGLAGFVRRRRRWSESIGMRLLFLSAVLAGMLTLTGCGSSDHSTSTITVTATSGSESHTATFTLTVK